MAEKEPIPSKRSRQTALKVLKRASQTYQEKQVTVETLKMRSTIDQREREHFPILRAMPPEIPAASIIIPTARSLYIGGIKEPRDLIDSSNENIMKIEGISGRRISVALALRIINLTHEDIAK